MITTVFKIPVLRFGLISLLVTCLCGATFYLYVQYNKSLKLRDDVNRLVTMRGNAAQIDSCILILYNADNDSRLYSVTGNTRYLSQFAAQVKTVDSVLDVISKSKTARINTSTEKISDLIDRKNVKTTDYLHLRRLSDSLIAAALIKSMPSHKNIVKRNKNYGAKNEGQIITPKRKKLFGRIADAFSSNNPAVTAPPKPAAADTVFIPQSTVPNFNYYRKLSKANAGMKNKEREMLYINSGIIHELIIVLERFKMEERRYNLLRKKELRGTIYTIFSDFSKLSALALILLILLVLTVLYNIYKIFRHEKQMVHYSAEASLFAAEKSTFLANMSHEIRTPLNSIAGFAEQLEQSKLSKEQYEQINAVRNSADMLLNVVNQVLDFSKYETGKMNFDSTSFLLNKVISEITVSMGILAEQKGLHLRTELSYQSDLHLAGDAFRLRQVMINLVGNAIKFTTTGEVVLKVWTTELLANVYNLHVAVKDTGMGISETQLPFIFKKFTQVGANIKQNRTGTGLGLAISKSIVELQGGKIFVESELNKGSVFSFNIPFKLGRSLLLENKTTFDEKEARLFLKNKHVLLVDDNSINIMLAKTILHKWNLTCEIAYNGREALSIFEKNEFDLVLTDIQMPEMNGVELAACIRQVPDQDKANIPILAITANVTKEDHEEYLESGINAIALKPFFERELIQKIEAVLKLRLPLPM
jgi:signal transduction histidine kinase/CHASE3 domain sensor protein